MSDLEMAKKKKKKKPKTKPKFKGKLVSLFAFKER